MLSDLLHLEVAELLVDICIVGAGPAGITLASQLRGTGLRVCLAEAGALIEEPETHALLDGVCTGHPMSILQGRNRGFGGSTLTWGGRCAELDAIDLEARSWIPNSGWPISWETLQRYYARARPRSNFYGSWTSDAQNLENVGHIWPAFEGEEIRPFVWRFAPPHQRRHSITLPRFGPRPVFRWGDAYREELFSSENIHVVLHANLVALEAPTSKTKITSARFSTLGGKELCVRAKSFVLCCGGIENTRVLLNLREAVGKQMLGGEQLGRNFAQHPRGTIAYIDADRQTALRLQSLFGKFTIRSYEPIQYELGIAVSEQAQRRYKMLNASAAFQYLPSESSAWLAGKRVRDALSGGRIYGGMYRDIGQLLSDGVRSFPNICRKYFTGQPLQFPTGVLRVVIDLEQPPRTESRISLANDADRLGVRKVAIDWKVGDAERQTALIFAGFVSRELRRLKLGRPKLAQWLTSNEPIREADLAGNYHFIGATRMSDKPEFGVVDSDSLVHGLKNLYVCGSSTFPTGGHANPTLTIIALAIRLADHLIKRFFPYVSD